MTKNHFNIGIVGLGVMGANLGLNIASRGCAVAGYNRHSDKAELFTQRGQEELAEITQAETRGTDNLADFIDALKIPRKIILMVPAAAVDQAINTLIPHLEAGDIIIDGGNSHFLDTERRLGKLSALNLHFIGMGISGGEEGARHGPSMMPGGESKAWELVRSLLEPAAARAADGEPCIAWMGSGGAGHFVKMTHNGIEYGLMQLIGEAYDLLRRGIGLTQEACRTHFQAWNHGLLNAYLIEITADILAQRDTDGSYLLDHILDTARQKGTGRWTTEAALGLGIPTPTIDAAVTARGLSDLRHLRQRAAERLAGPQPERQPLLSEEEIPFLEQALEAAFLITYAQGFQLIGEASREYGYSSNLVTVARIWRGGCIIRSALLEPLAAGYEADPELTNPLLDTAIAKRLAETEAGLRRIVAHGAQIGIPTPAMNAALAYYDALRSARLPANLIQAQRDYFGAHTYERLDQEGAFHTHWQHFDSQ